MVPTYIVNIIQKKRHKKEVSRLLYLDTHMHCTFMNIYEKTKNFMSNYVNLKYIVYLLKYVYSTFRSYMVTIKYVYESYTVVLLYCGVSYISLSFSV